MSMYCIYIQGRPKSKPLLNVKQATGVNANKNLLVLNIPSIKYSVYDVKCGINYCVYTYWPSRQSTHPSICH